MKIINFKIVLKLLIIFMIITIVLLILIKSKNINKTSLHVNESFDNTIDLYNPSAKKKINIVDCVKYPTICSKKNAKEPNKYLPYMERRASPLNKLNNITDRYTPAEKSDSYKWGVKNRSYIPPRFKRKIQ